MSRTKGFSEDEVLTHAAQVFTRLGYSATSFSTLTEELGVAKQSLCNAFGNKESLYLRALQHAAQSNQLGRVLNQSHQNGLQRIEAFFEAIISESCDPEHAGCMVVSGLPEHPADSAPHFALLNKWQSTQELLRHAIEEGQRDGSINSEQRSAHLAQALMVAMAGLRIMRKAIDDPSALRTTLTQVVRLHLDMLQR